MKQMAQNEHGAPSSLTAISKKKDFVMNRLLIPGGLINHLNSLRKKWAVTRLNTYIPFERRNLFVKLSTPLFPVC